RPAPTLFPYTTLFRSRTDRGTTATCDGARTPRLAKGVEVNDVHGAPSRSRQGLPGPNVGKLAGADKSVEAPPGFEPGVEVLQTRSEEHTSELQSPYDL